MNRNDDRTTTLALALTHYFDENGFGKNGGYDDAWVELEAGPVVYPFPNTASRKRAVRYHDLHHIVTGYRTNPSGEFEISAWEIGSGCRDYIAAWHLNLSGMAAGLLVSPRRTFRAFRRGRRSANFYGKDYEGLLEQTVAEAKRQCRADAEVPPPTVPDIVLFTLFELAGIVVGSMTLVVATPLALAALPFLRSAANKERQARAVPQ